MQHLDEGTIHAWLDSALDGDETRRIEAHLAECPPCAAAVAEARGLIAASSRVLSALDAVPGDVLPETRTAEATRATSTRWIPRVARVAAVLTIVAVGATVVTRRVVPSRSASEKAGARMAEPLVNATAPATSGSVPPASTARPTKSAPTPVKSTPATQATSAPAATRTSSARAKSADLAAASTTTAMAKSAVEARRSTLQAPLAVAPLRLVTTEQVVTPDAHVVLRRIYEVHPGMRVTLDEATPGNAYIEAADARASARAFAPAALPATETRGASGASTAPTPIADSVGAASMQASTTSIQWTDFTGRHFTLSGPFTVEELRQLKARLP